MSLADAIRILNEKVPPVPLPDNQREPLEATTGAGFPEVPPVPPANVIVASIGSELPQGDQAGHDIEVANQETILATAWTPAGNMVMVEADSVEHAEWIEAMNPKPAPMPMVRCCDCSKATIEAGIARCAAGVDSGLPIRGHWATDQHLCGSYWGIELGEVRHAD
jgi:hypothetical protein